jgi:hypothetical protein
MVPEPRGPSPASERFPAPPGASQPDEIAFLHFSQSANGLRVSQGMRQSVDNLVIGRKIWRRRRRRRPRRETLPCCRLGLAAKIACFLKKPLIFACICPPRWKSLGRPIAPIGPAAVAGSAGTIARPESRRLTITGASSGSALRNYNPVPGGFGGRGHIRRQQVGPGDRAPSSDNFAAEMGGSISPGRTCRPGPG